MFLLEVEKLRFHCISLCWDDSNLHKGAIQVKVQSSVINHANFKKCCTSLITVLRKPVTYRTDLGAWGLQQNICFVTNVMQGYSATCATKSESLGQTF